MCSSDLAYNEAMTVFCPVSWAGVPLEPQIYDKAKKLGLKCLEDAACSLGAKIDSGFVGKFADYSCFSFHPVKNLAMPTGGLVALNQKNFKQARKNLLSRRWCGITDRKEVDYDVKELGWNFYMNEFSAAVGLVQLAALDRLNKKRLDVAKRLHKELNMERKMPLNTDCVYHFYWILVKNRDQFRKKMSEIGIETGIHYKPIHKMTMYKDAAKLPITETVGQQIVTLPTHPNLTDDDLTKIIESVNKFC